MADDMQETPKQQFIKYASVVLDVAINKTLDYGIPKEFLSQVRRGVRIEVPVRGHARKGYVIEIKDVADFHRVQPITKVLSDTELITDDLFELATWMSRYYHAPLNQVFKVMLPSSIRKNMQHKQQFFVMRAKTREELQVLCSEIRNKHPAQAAVIDVMLKVNKGILLSELIAKTEGSRSPIDTLIKKGILVQDIVRLDRSPLVNEEYFPTKPKTLNPDQAQSLDKVTKSIAERRFETHLLYGITGSGKTEVYLQAIDYALKQGKGALMLVPEISLTTQTIERFRCRFEEKIAILHHRLSPGERFDEWHRIHRGEAKIVIGARSAVFSPVANLGLIIIDEEHEHSYKQSEEAPRYNARDVAVMRGKILNSSVILGSATPSLESYYNATRGKYTLSTLHCRAGTAATLPQVTIVDMKKEFEKAKGYTTFSDRLLDGIKRRCQAGEQTILFLNRRGYHTNLICKECGTAVKCAHCDVALTFHKGDNILSCHLCGFTVSPPPRQCRTCRSSNPMKFRGIGTEQVQKAIHAIFPEIRTLRLDADTTRHKGSHQKMLRDFGRGKADLLIGTQMVAKGLHFPEVTLVGVLNSDSSLNIPDFRASETAFQLMTQVSGRAGRGTLPGEVIIQTCMPSNSTIQLAAKQDYNSFYQEEIAVREMFDYPPFTCMVKVTFSGVNSQQTQHTAAVFRNQLRRLLPENFQLNAVVPAGHAKVKDQYRFQFLVRGPSIYTINQALSAIPQPKRVKVAIDVNPTSTFF